MNTKLEKLQESNKRRVHQVKFVINAGASNQENTAIQFHQ